MLDNLVLFLLLFCILYFVIRPWLPFTLKEILFSSDSEEDWEPIQGAVPDLLRKHGYEPLLEKVKTQILIDVDDEELESRLYFDYIAKKEEEYYLVTVARDRKPVRWSGAGVRDFFLASYLLVQPTAILYVMPELQQIKRIEFDFENRPVLEEEKKTFPWSYVITFLVGMATMWLILK